MGRRDRRRLCPVERITAVASTRCRTSQVDAGKAHAACHGEQVRNLCSKRIQCDPDMQAALQPGRLASAFAKTKIGGEPDLAHVSTGCAERANLTMQMHDRRWHSLTVEPEQQSLTNVNDPRMVERGD